MQPGKLEKARSCKLFYRVPVGYVRLSREEIILDPDPRVQAVVRLIFEKFVELGSCRKLLDYLHKNTILIPSRSRTNTPAGQLHWHAAKRDNLYAMLHHPIYAGAYAHGRIHLDSKHKGVSRQRKGRILLPWEKWKVLRKDVLPAYITWEQYLDNLRILSTNQTPLELASHSCLESSLVEGLVICGRCKQPMQLENGIPFAPSRFVCRHIAQTNGTREDSSVETLLIDELVSKQVSEAIQPSGLRPHLEGREKRNAKHKNCSSLLFSQAPHADKSAFLINMDLERHAFIPTLNCEEETAMPQESTFRADHSHTGKPQAIQSFSSVWKSILALATEILALWTAPSTTFADRRVIVQQLLKQVVIDAQQNVKNAEICLHWTNGVVSQHTISRLAKKRSK